MSKYEDEAKKVLILLLGGGHPEEFRGMKYVMDEAEILGQHRKQLHDAILDSLKGHSCSCRAHWKLAEIAKKVSAEDDARL